MKFNVVKKIFQHDNLLCCATNKLHFVDYFVNVKFM